MDQKRILVIILVTVIVGVFWAYQMGGGFFHVSEKQVYICDSSSWECLSNEQSVVCDYMYDDGIRIVMEWRYAGVDSVYEIFASNEETIKQNIAEAFPEVDINSISITKRKFKGVDSYYFNFHFKFNGENVYCYWYNFVFNNKLYSVTLFSRGKEVNGDEYLERAVCLPST